eukprot:11155914-Lingulodinium_polyedra.AAC.1
MRRACMRPGEADKLLHKQLAATAPAVGRAYAQRGLFLAPTRGGVAGKTGVLDEAILVDDPLP